MKLGILSDTHFTDLADGLFFLEELCSGPFADVDLILHAGDIVHPDLFYSFDKRPIIGVRGNCDEFVPDLPEKRIVEYSGYRIGLIHGWGGPDGIVNHVLDAFDGEQLDVLVFGHTHYPVCRYNGNLLLFNPGSATDRRTAPYHSAGILELNESVHGIIVNLDSRPARVVNMKGVSL
jgi:putative phosphoesterase